MIEPLMDVPLCQFAPTDREHKALCVNALFVEEEEKEGGHDIFSFSHGPLMKARLKQRLACPDFFPARFLLNYWFCFSLT